MKRLLLAALVTVAPIMGLAADYTFSTTAFNSLAHGQAGTWGLGGTSTGAERTMYTNLLNDLKTGNKEITAATLTLVDPRDWQAERRDVLYVNILSNLKLGTNKYTYNSNPSTAPNTSYGPNIFVETGAIDANDLAQLYLGFNDAETGSLLRAPNSSMPTNNTSGSNGFSAADLAAMPGTWTDSAGPYGSGANTNSISDVAITFTAANLALLEQYLRADSAPGSNPTVGLGFAAECHYYFSAINLSITVSSVPTQGVPDSGSTVLLMAGGVAALVGFRRRLAK